jgi:hypothetical protein
VKDSSLFKSRHPAVLKDCKCRRIRGWNLVSTATNYRRFDMVKMLLAGGEKPGNAIGYAAAIGSREMVKMFWDIGPDNKDAVQAAFVLAVARENKD